MVGASNTSYTQSRFTRALRDNKGLEIDVGKLAIRLNFYGVENRYD